MKSRYCLIIALSAAALSPSLAGCRKPIDKEAILAEISEKQQQALEPMVNTPLMVDGINNPAFVDASEAMLTDRTEVIGVSLNGQHRAYPIQLFTGMMDHVVNDLFSDAEQGTIPVTVTYCDMTDCIRVLTGPEDEASKTLNVGTLGLVESGLALRWNGQGFKQTEQIEGLVDVDFERTKWGQWKAKYPDSKVYVGKQKQQ